MPKVLADDVSAQTEAVGNSRRKVFTMLHKDHATRRLKQEGMKTERIKHSHKKMDQETPMTYPNAKETATQIPGMMNRNNP
jgi:hypothetical protein